MERQSGNGFISLWREVFREDSLSDESGNVFALKKDETVILHYAATYASFTGKVRFYAEQVPVYTCAQHKVSYNVVSEDGTTVPDAVKKLFPEEKLYFDGSQVKALQLTEEQKTVSGENGIVWTFSKYDKGEALVKGQEVVFTATWIARKDPAYVTYLYESGTEGKELPSGIKAPEKEMHDKGDTITLTAPDPASVPAEDGSGTWTFQGYDGYPDGTVTLTGDIEVKGVWTFLAHDYTGVEPEFKWSADLTSAQVTVECKDCHEVCILGDAEVNATVQAATCEADGETRSVATFEWNGKTYTDEKSITIPAEGHKMVHTSAKAKTCTEDGTIEYWTCSVCHKMFKDADGKEEITSEDELVDKASRRILTISLLL